MSRLASLCYLVEDTRDPEDTKPLAVFTDVDDASLWVERQMGEFSSVAWEREIEGLCIRFWSFYDGTGRIYLIREIPLNPQPRKD